MAPIMVGGDDSVIWTTHADRVRSTKTSSVGTKHDQEGIDETDKGGQFKVTIKLPTNRDERSKFMAQLSDFIAKPQNTLVLTLPIEDKAYIKATTDKDTGGVHDQIKIDWPVITTRR